MGKQTSSIGNLPDWERVSKPFTNMSAIRPRSTWLATGMSSRISNSRLGNLWTSPQGRHVRVTTADMDAPTLERLIGMARVNLEQAQAASRVTVFINVTVIVAVTVVSNQLFPGWLKTAVTARAWYSEGLIGVLVSFALLASFTSAYSWGGVASARDLLNLLELRAAGLRGQGSPRRTEDDEGNPVTDLRSAQLSDL